MNHTVELSVRKINGSVFADTSTFFINQILPTRKVPVSLESLTRVTTTATATLKNHGLVTGDSVEIESVAPFDGTFTVTVLNSDQFTFTVLNSGATSDSNAKLYQTVMWYNQFLGGGNQPTEYTVAQSITGLEALLPEGFAAIGTVVRDYQSATRLTVPYTALFTSFAGIQLLNNVSESLGIQSITRSSTTATVTTSVAHGLQTGDYVTVAGAVETEYNVTAQITVTGTSTFTYTVSGSPSTPATGTITYVLEGCRIMVYEQRYANWFFDLQETYAAFAALFTAGDDFDIKSSSQATSGALTTAAGATSTFTITDAAITSTSEVIVTLKEYSGTFATDGIPIVFSVAPGTGDATVTVANIHATNALDGTVTVMYVVV